MDDAPSVQLVDGEEGAGRTTASLVASLASRLAAVSVMNGASLLGSLNAGYAALGRRAARTAAGARLRRALAEGRVATNGEALWAALGIDRLTASVAPTPVLEQARNDLALLAAGDLEEALALLPIPDEPGDRPTGGDDAPPTFVDHLLGMWAYTTEVARSIEALAAPTLPPPGQIVRGAPSQPLDGPILR